MAAKGKYDHLNRFCNLHGKVRYLKSKIADAELCEECVTNGYYNADIVAEARQKHPEIFGSRSTNKNK
jgi:hypothetical protein